MDLQVSIVTKAILFNALREPSTLFIVGDVLRDLVVSGQPSYCDRNHGSGILLLEEGCQRFQQKGFKPCRGVRNVRIHPQLAR